MAALADGDSIDWDAAARLPPKRHSQAFIQALRTLEAMRDVAPPASRPESDGHVPLALVLACSVGLAQLVAALAAAALGVLSGTAPESFTSPLLLLATFVTASLALGPAALRDGRAFLLLATFALAGSAFAHPLLARLPDGERALASPLFRGMYPEVFACAALWKFAALVPAVQRFTGPDIVARRGTQVAYGAALGLGLLNLLLAYGARPPAEALNAFGRNDPRYLYWQAFAALMLPPLALIVIRARHASNIERGRVARLACAMALGAGPFVLLGVARLFPPVDHLVRLPGVRAWTDLLVLVPLALLPILTAAAVLMDAPFAANACLPARRSGLRRWGLGWTASRRLRDRLPVALEAMRRTRSKGELIEAIVTELRDAMAATGRIVPPDELPVGGALVHLLESSTVPVDLACDEHLFAMLPKTDRSWAEARRADLVSAIRDGNGAAAAVLLLAGEPRRSFTPAERWFVHMLMLCAGAIWESSPVSENEAPALECTLCGLVHDPLSTCCRRGSSVRADLPRRLGAKFTILRRLGRGGMGVVYLARDPILGRDVALKTLPSMGGAKLPMLLEEARLMAALNHPGIATIYGVEVWRGVPVLVIEYFPAGTLAELLADRLLTQPETVRLGIQMAQALGYLHARGVLHRDVKPSNIGFTADRTPKLLDFGLAGAHNATAGTRPYLAPEALKDCAPDAPLDLWALATVLAECCKPDERLERLLHRARAPQPADRFQSAEELSSALLALLSLPED